MTEAEATPRRATLPDDPDELADLIIDARTRILQLRNLAGVFRAEERIRNDGTDSWSTLGDPAELEALADYFLVMQRNAMEALFAHCARAAHAGELSPALVRHACRQVGATRIPADYAPGRLESMPSLVAQNVSFGRLSPAVVRLVGSHSGRRCQRRLSEGNASISTSWRPCP